MSPSTYVEGMGDEIVFLFMFLSCLATIIVIFIYMYRFKSRRQIIHPESLASVNLTRDGLNNRNDGLDSNTNASGASTAGARYATHSEDNSIQCPICLDRGTMLIETNCGHVFCGTCVVAFWRYGSRLAKMKCPVCRQLVSALLTCFTSEENELLNTSECPEHLTEMLNYIRLYNRRFSGQPLAWSDYINDLPILLRHAFSDFFSHQGLMLVFRLRIVVCCFAVLLYFLSPLDIFPESVFGFFGLIDDLIIALCIAIYITILYRSYLESQPIRGQDSASMTNTPPADGATTANGH